MGAKRQFIDVARQFLEVLWQLPQWLLGLAVGWWYRRGAEWVTDTWNGVTVLYSSKMRGGVSFGRLVILPYKYRVLRGVNLYVAQTHAHEYGHCVQSRRLGWLYLPVVGLPSLCWAWAHSNIDRLQTVDYYSFWTERWANRLGGVED